LQGKYFSDNKVHQEDLFYCTDLQPYKDENRKTEVKLRTCYILQLIIENQKDGQENAMSVSGRSLRRFMKEK
jgi:hypothetical protein